MYAAAPALAVAVASWIDPGDNGFDVSDALEVCLFIAALYGGGVFAAKVVRWIDARKDKRHRLDVEDIMRPHLAKVDAKLEQMHTDLDAQTDALLIALQDATQLISVGYRNNGTSITDVSETLGKVKDSTERIEGRLEAVENAQKSAVDERATILRVADQNAAAIADAVRQLGGDPGPIAPLSPAG